MYGKERLLVVVLVLLCGATVISAVATTLPVMLVGRVAQGAAGGIFPIAFGIIRDEFPRERVAGAIGVMSALAGVGGGVGLALAVPDLLGLRADADPPVRDHGAAGDPHLHARLDRRRRGRPDASADRAAGPASARRRGSSTCGPATRTRSSRRGGWIMRSQHDPVALILSRQNLPTLDRSRYRSAEGVARGAYVLADPAEGEPEVILIATGSEIALAVEAYEQLGAEGVAARVVSMPSWELFERQPTAYRASVLPPTVGTRVAIEQASTFGWERYVGATGAIVCMSTFGASAPLKELQTKFGFTPERSVEAAHDQIRSLERGSLTTIVSTGPRRRIPRQSRGS
jgi:Transketolase, C-terminal domain/Major Facilitator Superfamily